MWKKWIAAMLIGCISLLGAAAAVSAAAQTYGSSFTEGGSSLMGLSASSQQYFEVPDYWKVENVQVKLDYQVSQLAITERSSVTLTMNGTPFHSFRPDPANQAKQRLTVAVPKELIAKGVNTLSVNGQVDTQEVTQVCMPDERRGNWLQIYDSSIIDIGYTAAPVKNSISDFARHFIGIDTLESGGNAILVPAQSEAIELEAAVHTLSGFAKASTLKDKQIPILPYSDANMKGKKTAIVVALYDRLPASLQSKVDKNGLDKKAVLQLVQLTGGVSVLVMTSSNGDLLVKAGRLAANQELVNQLQGAVKEVNDSTDVTTPEVSITRTMALTEAGDELKGAAPERSFFISLPSNRSVAEASKVELQLRYAKNLNFDRSLVTIKINNTPIGSKRLTEELANGDTVTMNIPKNLSISGNFTVTAAFNLEQDGNYCVQGDDDKPWAYIAKESKLQVNTKDRTELLFNNYPYPFLRDGSFNQVTVVLPTERDAYTYRTVTNLFNLLGQYAEGNTGEVRFVNEDVSADELNNRNLIVIGSYKSNKLIRESNDKLFFRYDANGETIASNEKMSIDSDYGKRIGTLQLLDSPYGSANGMLAVTGASPEYQFLASKLVASQSTMWKIFGDGATTDKDGNIQAFRFKQAAGDEPALDVADVLGRGDVLAFMATLLSVLVLVFVSLLLLVRKYRKRRREGR
jgi:hypothetical protein